MQKKKHMEYRDNGEKIDAGKGICRFATLYYFKDTVV